MPRTCATCSHPKRVEIEREILAGTSFRRIEERFGASASSVLRHRDNCLSRSIVRAAAADEDATALSHLEQLRELQAEMRRLGRQAETDGDLRAALVALKQAGDLIEIIARLMEVGSAQGAGLPDVDPRVVRLLSGLSDRERLEFAASGSLPLAARKEAASWLTMP
jgi:hypothetical protein